MRPVFLYVALGTIFLPIQAMEEKRNSDLTPTEQLVLAYHAMKSPSSPAYIVNKDQSLYAIYEQEKNMVNVYKNGSGTQDPLLVIDLTEEPIEKIKSMYFDDSNDFIVHCYIENTLTALVYEIDYSGPQTNLATGGWWCIIQ